MDSLVTDEVFRRSYCHLTKRADTHWRKTFFFITFFDKVWDVCLVDVAVTDVKKRLLSYYNFKNAIFQLEAAPSTGNLHTHICLAVKNSGITKIPQELHDLFPGAWIIALENGGVEEVRKYCSKLYSRMSDVEVMGEGVGGWVEKYAGAWAGTAQVVKSASEVKDAVAVSRMDAKRERKPWLDEITTTLDMAESAQSEADKLMWEEEAERLKKLGSEEWAKTEKPKPKVAVKR